MGSDTEFQHEYAGHLVREVLAGRMTRRELLVRAGVVGLSATLVGQVLAACGSSSSSNPTVSRPARHRRRAALSCSPGTRSPPR